MRIDWMNIGAEYNGTDEQKKRISGIVDRLDWLDVPGPGAPPLEVAMMPGEAIKSLIKEFRIPKVSRVAISLVSVCAHVFPARPADRSPGDFVPGDGL